MPTPAVGWDAKVKAKVAAVRCGQQHDRQGRLLHGHLRHPAPGRRHRGAQRRRHREPRAGAARRDGALPGRHRDDAGLPEPARSGRSPACWCSARRTSARSSPARSASRRSRSTPARRPSPATSRASAARPGRWCAVLPVTIPVNTVTCDGSNDARPNGDPMGLERRLHVPLCKNDPGNVGWLDWNPPAGGASEIVCSIINPDNPAIMLPSWQFVAATGNMNGGGSAPTTRPASCTRRRGSGPQVRRPDRPDPAVRQTCRTKNAEPEPDQPAPTVEHDAELRLPEPGGGGDGQNIWYRMPSFAYFAAVRPVRSPTCGGRHGAYISGSNRPSATRATARRRASSASSSTSCRPARSGPGRRLGHQRHKALGVQLIK